jgi:3-deoxy-manno-octulosonate cytidylyltransferase (CMP-KDO synthetase)
MHILPIIPARFESERFPGKLLAKYKHRQVIDYPISACLEAFNECVVLTNDNTIATNIEQGSAILFGGSYRNGTERIADACNRLNIANYTLIMHVQGDEVGLNPEDLKRLATVADIMADSREIATLFYRTDDEKLLKSPDHVKCWRWDIGRDPPSWNFSRLYERDVSKARDQIHVGVYCYRRWMLNSYMANWPTDDEKRERLEQLRWEYPIIAYEVAPCKAINVPDDLA